MARLRGAATVIVGIQPDVAFAIVELGMDLDIHTALDLEEGLALLERDHGRQPDQRIGHRGRARQVTVMRGTSMRLIM